MFVKVMRNTKHRETFIWNVRRWLQRFEPSIPKQSTPLMQRRDNNEWRGMLNAAISA
jgi:hypothetical protein